MRNINLVVGLLLLTITTQAQVQKPIKWNFNAVKKSAQIYEMHMTATIDKTWRIYSGDTPGGGPSPTKISFAKNPLVMLSGKVKEVGNLHKIHEEAFGVDVWYFQDKVDFVQVVVKKLGVKTNFSGTVEFMTCDQSQCLPPEKEIFTIQLK